MKTLTPLVLARGVHYCIDNAKRYVSSATSLQQTDRQTSYLLCLYALEEIGKVPIIWNALFYVDSESDWQKWNRKFKDHGEKFWFSKDLDDIANGKMAATMNETDTTKAQTKLAVAYVDLKGANFVPPVNISESDLSELLSSCDKRLGALNKTHPSVQVTEANITFAADKLKGLSLDELKNLIAQEQGTAHNDDAN